MCAMSTIDGLCIVNSKCHELFLFILKPSFISIRLKENKQRQRHNDILPCLNYTGRG